MIQLELFYLNIKHYNSIGDFYFRYCQMNEKGKVAYVGYHCNETGHTLSSETLEKLVRL